MTAANNVGRPRRQVESITYGVNGSVQLSPCVDCEFWHAEVIAETDLQGEVAEVIVREWHEGSCPSLSDSTADNC